MTQNDTDEVERWIREHEPVDQDVLKDVFGKRGLQQLQELMENNKVSYTLDWNLQTETGHNE